jgi:hypothetical protein
MAAQDVPIAPSCALAPGWVQAGQPRYYTTDNLFEYMDGNSEGYFSYNFQSMRGVTCGQGGTTFVIDISDMGDADNAFGWFSATRDPRQPAYAVGMGGQIVPRRLIFAKGKYYVEIAANPEGDFTAALQQWAGALDRLVPGSSSPPVALSWFSAEGRQSLKLVPQSVLGLSVLKRGYLAQYAFGKAFVVKEETEDSAAAAMQKLRRRFADAATVSLADDAFQATDKYLGRLCFVRSGRFLAGYAVTAEGADPVALSATLVKAVQ